VASARGGAGVQPAEAETGVPVQPLDGVVVERGADFGEDSIMEVPSPGLAVVTDEPVDDRAYGATWFTLE